MSVLAPQSCPTLCNPMDCSPPVSSVQGIFQARLLEWAAMPSFGGSSWLRDPFLPSIITGRLSTIWATRDADNWSCPFRIPNWTSLVAQTVRRLPTMWETWVRSLGREDSWRRKWQPTPVLLPGKSHGRRSLVGCSPWGLKESDMTEWLHFFSLPNGALSPTWRCELIGSSQSCHSNQVWGSIRGWQLTLTASSPASGSRLNFPWSVWTIG